MSTTLTPEALQRAMAAACKAGDYAELPTRVYDALIEGWYALLNEPSGDSGQLPQAAPAAACVPLLEPSQECYSDDGDHWRDDPADADFVAGLNVGDTYELMVSHYSVQRTYVVTKVPDDHCDDYEVEPRPSPQVRDDDSQGKASG